MLGILQKKDKEILLNKQGIIEAMNGKFSPRKPSEEKSNIVYIYGQESPEQLLKTIMSNESEYRASICLLIQSTIGCFDKSITKNIILKLKKLDYTTYKQLEKTGFLKRIGLKPKWQFW